VLARAKTFGNNPICNPETGIVFFFHKFSALGSGRALGIALLVIFGPMLLFRYALVIMTAQVARANSGSRYGVSFEFAENISDR
jgi:hypothetical protein